MSFVMTVRKKCFFFSTFCYKNLIFFQHNLSWKIVSFFSTIYHEKSSLFSISFVMKNCVFFQYLLSWKSKSFSLPFVMKIQFIFSTICHEKSSLSFLYHLSLKKILPFFSTISYENIAWQKIKSLLSNVVLCATIQDIRWIAS